MSQAMTLEGNPIPLVALGEKIGHILKENIEAAGKDSEGTTIYRYLNGYSDRKVLDAACAALGGGYAGEGVGPVVDYRAFHGFKLRPSPGKGKTKRVRELEDENATLRKRLDALEAKLDAAFPSRVGQLNLVE